MAPRAVAGQAEGQGVGRALQTVCEVDLGWNRICDYSSSSPVIVQSSTPTGRLGSRLAIALGAVVLATTLVTVVGMIRPGHPRWLISLSRIILMVWLSVLVLRGVRWARWVLMAGLSLWAIGYLAFSLAVATYPFEIVLFIGTGALCIWAVVELTLADIAASGT